MEAIGPGLKDAPGPTTPGPVVLSSPPVDALRPELALISCGYNSYGHPSPDTLQRLAARDILPYRTDTMGTISIYVRSDGYAAQSQG